MDAHFYKGEYFNFSHDTSLAPEKEYLPLHAHEVFEVYLFLNGEGTYIVEGSEYQLKPETVLIMRAAEMHKPNIIAGIPYERATIHFNPEFLTKLDPEHRLLRPFVERTLGRDNLYDRTKLRSNLLYDCFYNMFHASGDFYEETVRLSNMFYCILGEIEDAWSRLKSSGGREEGSLIAQITHYIEAHLGEELSLSHLQSRFYISKSQLTRLFKEATGLAVWEYISVKRLTLARSRLREGMRAGDVAASCGFGDYSSFYRSYKKRFGVSPTAHEKEGKD